MASVSVITIAKDHFSGLRETFASLTAQDYDDWEMLIVVGASKDSTLQIANEFATKDSRVKVIEQSGLGIYEGMNEGIRRATGEFSWFMNAGDEFANAHVLDAAVEEMKRTKVGLVIGGYGIQGRGQEESYSFPRKEMSDFDFAFSRRGGCHQAMIIRTELIERVGGFDTHYSLASDFDLVLKAIKLGGAVRVPEIYASIEPGGLADQGIFSVHRQKHQIRRRFFGGSAITFLSLAWTMAARSKIILRRFF